MPRALLVFWLTSCASSPSTPTAEISAFITANATSDNHTDVNASLRDSSVPSLPVTLADDDSLVVRAAGLVKTMDGPEPGANFVSFALGVSGTRFEIAFERDSYTDAPGSIATLPEAFVVGGPTTMSRAQDLTLTWSPSGSMDAMSWEASGSCIESTDDVALSIQNDPGVVTIPAGGIVARASATNQTCEVTFTITRSRAGVADENFRRGTSLGQQSRSVKISSTP